MLVWTIACYYLALWPSLCLQPIIYKIKVMIPLTSGSLRGFLVIFFIHSVCLFFFNLFYHLVLDPLLGLGDIEVNISDTSLSSENLRVE